MSDRIQRLRAQPDPALVNQLEALIHQVVDGLEEGRNCDALVAEINTLSGQNYKAEFFFELYGWTGEREAAEAAAKGPAPLIDDLTRDELIAIIADFREIVEPNSTYFMELLELNFDGAWDYNLPERSWRTLSNEEVVDELMLQHGLYRSGGEEAVRARKAEIARQVLDYPDAPSWSRVWAETMLKRR